MITLYFDFLTKFKFSEILIKLILNTLNSIIKKKRTISSSQITFTILYTDDKFQIN